MTVTIPLDADLERRLRESAHRDGLPLEAFAAEVLARFTKPDSTESWLDRDVHAECEADGEAVASLEAVRSALATIPGDLTADFLAERDERG